MFPIVTNYIQTKTPLTVMTSIIKNSEIEIAVDMYCLIEEAEAADIQQIGKIYKKLNTLFEKSAVSYNVQYDTENYITFSVNIYGAIISDDNIKSGADVLFQNRNILEDIFSRPVRAGVNCIINLILEDKRNDPKLREGAEALKMYIDKNRLWPRKDWIDAE